MSSISTAELAAEGVGLPPLAGRSPAEVEELVAAIEYIRPAIQADGGDIELDRVEGTHVVVRLRGACEGCPMSTFTLVAGVERLLTDMVPWVTAVSADGVDTDWG